MTDQLLLTVTEAAKKVGGSPKTFRQQVLPHVQTRQLADGGYRYVVASSLIEWIERGDAA